MGLSKLKHTENKDKEGKVEKQSILIFQYCVEQILNFVVQQQRQKH